MGEEPVTRAASGPRKWAIPRLDRGHPALAWAALAVALLSAPVLLPALDRATLGGRILRGVWAGPIALSALGASEATVALTAQQARLQQRTLTLRVGSTLVEVKGTDVGFAVGVDETVAAALRCGRSGGLLARTATWWGRWRQAAQIPLAGRTDPARRATLADRIDQRVIERRPFGGGLAVSQGQVVSITPHGGLVVDRERFGPTLEAAFSDPAVTSVEVPLRAVDPPLTAAAVAAVAKASQRLVSGPVTLIDPTSNEQIEVAPAVLAAALAGRMEPRPRPQFVAYLRPEVIADRLRSALQRLEQPPRDARFDVDQHDRVRIVPEVPGVGIDPGLVADALALAARAPGRTGVLPLDRATAPQRTAADLAALHVRKLVSEFTTHHPCCRPRVENIHRIADLLDGTIVAPGETFSVNKAVGPRTRQNGFVPAPTIEEGEMVDSLGGGISQFATTLFNAVFHGGYDIVERTPHSYYFARYPMGHEATLSYPKPDLVFKNDTAAGMLLRCEYGKTFIRVRVFGDNGGRRVRAKVSNRYDIQKPHVEYVPNPAIEPDDEKVLEAGSIGWTVTVSRVVAFADGTEKNESRKVTYNPRVRRVEVHPCRIPEGEKGYTGEECPVPEDSAEEPNPDIPDSIPADSPLDEGF
jgi:vancomycin resistance protein YoaR